MWFRPLAHLGGQSLAFFNAASCRAHFLSVSFMEPECRRFTK
jgi:hypothetical protein